MSDELEVKPSKKMLLFLIPAMMYRLVRVTILNKGVSFFPRNSEQITESSDWID